MTRDYIAGRTLPRMAGAAESIFALSAVLLLTIGGVSIRQDADGRFCLNDLHRAAGGEQKQKPSEWLRNGQTKELVAEIEKAGIPAIQARQKAGTYVVKELVHAYAMWISPSFHLKVIRAYDAMVTQAVAPASDPRIPKSFSEALMLAAQTQAEKEASVQKANELEAQVAKAHALLRIGAPGIIDGNAAGQ